MRDNVVNYIIIFTLVFIIGVLLFKKYYPVAIIGDQLYYHNVSVKLASFETNLDSGYDIASAVTPGYPLIIAFCYLFFGQSQLPVYILQLLFYLISILTVYYLLKETTNNILALIGAIAISLYVDIWKMTISLMMEVSTIFLLTISLLLLYKLIQSNRTAYIIVFSIVFCYLIFLNNRFIAHYIVFLAVLHFAFYLKWHETRRKHILISGLIVFIFLFSWHLRQYYVFDKIVVFAPYRMVDLEEIGGFKSYDDCKNEIRNSGYSDESKKLFEEKFTTETYKELKSEYENRKGIKLYISRAKEFWRISQFDISLAPGDSRIIPPSSFSKNILNILILPPFFLLSLAGVYHTIKNKNIFYLIITSFIIAHWILHSIVHYVPRYRITIIPLIVILAVYGLNNLINKFFNRKINC